MKRVYFSIPVSIDWSVASSCINRLKDKYDVKFWHRNTYYSGAPLDNCDIFILMLPDNKWNYSIEELPVGCKRELKRAMLLNKRLYIVYKNSFEYAFYKASISNNIITGIAGTTGDIYNDDAEYVPCGIFHRDSHDTSYDRRLLLLL